MLNGNFSISRRDEPRRAHPRVTMWPSPLIAIVLLGGPQCGAALKVMREAQAAEMTSGNPHDPRLHLYLATDEMDRQDRRIFRYSGKTRERQTDPTE